MARRLLPRLRYFFFIMVLAGALATGSRMLNTDSDLGRHLTLGEYMLSARQVPTDDILSYTKARESRPPYEWLAQVLLAVAYRLLNLDGVVLLTSLVIAATFTIVYLDSLQRSRAPILALGLSAWAAVASSLHWLARPHVFSFLLFSVWLFGLERVRRGQAWPIWAFPALMLLWSNLHGGFIFGFVALGAYLAGWCIDLIRRSADQPYGTRLLLIGLTSAIASIITPDWWHNWDAVLNNRSTYVLSQTVETMPVRITTPGVWPFLILLALALVLMALKRLRIPAAHLLLLGGLAGMSIAMARNIPLFAVAAAPILTEWAADVLSPVVIWRRVEDRFAEIDAGLQGVLWPALTVLIAVCAFAYRDQAAKAPVFQFSPGVFPVQAADWASQHPPAGRMFNDFNWGGYLLYRLWPQQKVFIDSQSDFYGEALTRQSAEIAAGDPGWQSELEHYQVNWMLIPRSSGLAEAVRQDPAWHLAYEDQVSVIYFMK